MTDILTLESIHVQGNATSKEDAIRKAGELLVKVGCVQPEYIDSMLDREKTMSTYLGNGVSIPHGEFEGLSLVNRTGISVLQVPEGVEWEDGELAYLIVGIAATGGEHIQVLKNLANVIEDLEKAELLSKTKDPAVILETLLLHGNED